MSSWPAQQGALCVSPKWIMNCIYSALRILAFLLETDMTKSCLFHLLKDKLMPGCYLMYPIFLCGSHGQHHQRQQVLPGGSRNGPCPGTQVSSPWVSGCPGPVDPSLETTVSKPEAPVLDIIFCWPNKLIILAKCQVFIFILNKNISLQNQKNNFQCHLYFSQT